MASSPDTARRSPEAGAILATYALPEADTARALRDLLLQADPRIEEAVKWKSPSYRLDVHFATFNVRPDRPLTLVLHRGAKPRPEAPDRLPIPDALGLLDWRTNDRANVTLASAEEVEAKREALTSIVQAWIIYL